MLTFLLFLAGLPFWSLPALDSPRFAERQEARRILTRSYPWSVPFAWSLNHSATSPEVRQSADNVLDRFAIDLDRRWEWVWDARVWLLVANQSNCGPGRMSYLGDSPAWLSRYEAQKAVARIAYRMRVIGVRPTNVWYTTKTVEIGNGQERRIAVECEVLFWFYSEVSVFQYGKAYYSRQCVESDVDVLRMALRGIEIHAGKDDQFQRRNRQRSKIKGDLFIPPFVIERLWDVRVPLVLPMPGARPVPEC